MSNQCLTPASISLLQREDSYLTERDPISDRTWATEEPVGTKRERKSVFTNCLTRHNVRAEGPLPRIISKRTTRTNSWNTFDRDIASAVLEGQQLAKLEKMEKLLAGGGVGYDGVLRGRNFKLSKRLVYERDIN